MWCKNMSDKSYILSRAKNRQNAVYMLGLGYELSKEFVLVYKDKLEPDIYKMLNQYGNMSNYGKIKRLEIIVKYKLWKNGLIRKIGQIIYM